MINMVKSKRYIKQVVKMCVQNVILPMIYFCNKFRPVEKGRVLMADAHNRKIPFCMRKMSEALEAEGYQVEYFFSDYQKDAWLVTVKKMFSFMLKYTQAEYVIICDSFLPVASCKKKKETKVIQLWHAGGALKKFGYDAEEDIAPYYKGNIYKNYTWVTVSDKKVIPYFSGAMHLPSTAFVATGLSRTDYYYEKGFREAVKEIFYKEYPEAAGKKIVLWAPTFRGNPSEPKVAGAESIAYMEKELGESYFVIKRLHPNMMNVPEKLDLSTEELLGIADVLITDYSSIIFDFMLYRKPIIKFVPDFVQYESKRGFYIPYEELPGQCVMNGTELTQAVQKAEDTFCIEDIEICIEKYMSACNGNATKKILRLMKERG